MTSAADYTYKVHRDLEDPDGDYKATCVEYGCVVNAISPETAIHDCYYLVDALMAGKKSIPSLGGVKTPIFPTALEIKKKAKHSSFDDMLFLGSGNWICPQIALLHERLDYALMYLGGEQQNGGMGSEYNLEYEKQYQQVCSSVVWDIIIALGLKNRFQQIES